MSMRSGDDQDDPVYDRADTCLRCGGCGQIANDDDGSPWSHWEALPEEAKLAIRMGIVFPVECPACGGKGEGRP